MLLPSKSVIDLPLAGGLAWARRARGYGMATAMRVSRSKGTAADFGVQLAMRVFVLRFMCNSCVKGKVRYNVKRGIYITARVRDVEKEEAGPSRLDPHVSKDDSRWECARDDSKSDPSLTLFAQDDSKGLRSPGKKAPGDLSYKKPLAKAGCRAEVP